MSLVYIVLLRIGSFPISNGDEQGNAQNGQNEGKRFQWRLKPARACVTESPDCCFAQHKVRQGIGKFSISRELNEYQISMQTLQLIRKQVLPIDLHRSLTYTRSNSERPASNH